MKVKEFIEFCEQHGLEEYEIYIEYVPLGTVYANDRRDIVLQEKSIEIGKNYIFLSPIYSVQQLEQIAEGNTGEKDETMGSV